MYAIIESCGRQYKVSEGDIVFFEKLDTEVGKKVKVVEHGKGKKILVYKYKAKKNYRRTQGHRQPFTSVEITKIALTAAKAEKEEVAEEKKETKTTAKKTTETKATTKTTTKKATEKKETVEA